MIENLGNASVPSFCILPIGVLQTYKKAPKASDFKIQCFYNKNRLKSSLTSYAALIPEKTSLVNAIIFL